MTNLGRRLRRQFERVNNELWVLLSLFLIALLLNYVVASQRMVLSFYMLPTLGSAYFRGRRHATLTALASVLLVVGLMLYADAFYPNYAAATALPWDKWVDVTVWGGLLLVTGYLMGTLYEHKTAQVEELRATYHGVLMILRHFISKDKYTENHCSHVSVYATCIATCLDLSEALIEDVRSAALLHDIGKLDISRDLLYKAARLTREETEQVKMHIEKGGEILHPVGGALHRILPIVLAHHDNFDGSGHHPTRGEDHHPGGRIISFAHA